MTEIDKTNRTRSTSNSTGTNESRGPDEAESPESTESTSASGGSQWDSPTETGDRFRENRMYSDTIYGHKPDGTPRLSPDSIGDGVAAHELQSAQTARQARKEDLGEALDDHTRMLRRDEDASQQEWDGRYFDLGSLGDKSPAQWADHYATRAKASGYRGKLRDRVRTSLVGAEGEPLSDSDLREVVSDHRAELADDGAFEDWDVSEIDSWERGVVRHLKTQRAKAALDNFQTDHVDGLPELEYDLEDRHYENPDKIRQKLDAWEEKQLSKLDKLAEGLDAEEKSTHRRLREDIRNARDAYEKITVGDEDGTKYGYPETVDRNLEGDQVPVRAAYVNHLRHEPGDLLGAYQEVQDRMKYAARSSVADQVVDDFPFVR